MPKFSRTSDGGVMVKGKRYETLTGTRAQVWHGTAYKTSGGLKHADLAKNKSGRIVSRKKQTTARREKRLQKHGYFAQKGKFGAVKRGTARRSRRGGSGVNFPLRPAPISGIKDTSGVDIQFVAGNATS